MTVQRSLKATACQPQRGMVHTFRENSLKENEGKQVWQSVHIYQAFPIASRNALSTPTFFSSPAHCRSHLSSLAEIRRASCRTARAACITFREVRQSVRIAQFSQNIRKAIPSTPIFFSLRPPRDVFKYLSLLRYLCSCLAYRRHESVVLHQIVKQAQNCITGEVRTVYACGWPTYS